MRFATLLLFSLLIPFPAFAGALEDGTAAMIRGDWPAAVKLLQPLAEQGNAQAQVDMGDMYMFGHGVKKDPAKALTWYRKAADQGNAAAELNVGRGYEAEGPNKDMPEAMKWILRAADQGYGPAQLALAGMYAHGDGIKKDDQEAYFRFLLFRKTVPEGIADQGQFATIEKLYAGDPTPEQRAAAKKRADEWKPIAPAPPLDLPAKAH